MQQDKQVWGEILLRCRGICELCGKPPDWRGLHPHEKVFRSHGGKVSLENTVAACGRSHSKEHGIKEVDSKPQLKWIEL